MLKHRCPWCGEPINISLLIDGLIRTYKVGEFCPHCKKPLKSFFGAATIIFILLFIVFFTLDRYNKLPWKLPGFIYIISFITIVIILLKMPYTRYYRKKEKHVEAEHEALKRKADTQIQWYSHKDGGLWLPRLRLLNHEILPAYFLDKNGVLMSGGLCVALTHIHWKGWKQCFCSIELVLDDAPAAVLEHGNRFYLYYREQQIAEGVVQTVLF